MKRSRRKYEDAGGVVAIRWQKGYPWRYGKVREAVSWGYPVLAEVWTTSLHDSGARIHVNARITCVTDTPGGLLFDGNKLEARQEVRRWCVLRDASTNIPVTVQDWPKEDE